MDLDHGYMDGLELQLFGVASAADLWTQIASIFKWISLLTLTNENHKS